MSERYVIVSILAGAAIASDEVYGTWQTYEAAQAQADIWQRKADRIALPGSVAFEVKPLRRKVRSRVLAELWKQLGEDAS